MIEVVFWPFRMVGLAIFYCVAFLFGRLKFEEAYFVRVHLRSGEHTDVWMKSWERTSRNLSWKSFPHMYPQFSSGIFEDIVAITTLKTRHVFVVKVK